MKKSVMLFLLCIQWNAWGGNPEKDVNTKVDNVTVFLSGAQISRSATIHIASGTTLAKFSNLSADIDERSIKVKGEGNFTVLSVTFQVNYLKEPEKTKEIEELLKQKEILEDKLDIENSMLNVYQQEEALLMENKNLGGTEAGISANELKEAAIFYRSRLTEIKFKQLEVKKNLKKLSEGIAKLNGNLSQLNTQQNKPTGEVLVTLSSKSEITAKVSLVYFIKQAGWHPSYDMRVKTINEPLSLVYKANVFQDSGENWENIRLKLSTADPAQGGTKPVLYPKYLAMYGDQYKGYISSPVYAPVNPSVREVRGRVTTLQGESIQGVNVMVKETTVGTTTDVNGNYSIHIPANSSHLVFSFIGYISSEVPVSSSMINITLMEDMQMLNELLVIGYGGGASEEEVKAAPSKREKTIIPLETTQVQNQTSVEFEIKVPYSVPSGKGRYAVEIEEYSVPATYEYFAVPKLDKDAFLTAKVTGWEDLNLLSGEANLFFEDTYVGKSVLDLFSTSDTLFLSLGRDKNIVIERKQVKNYVSKQMVGTNKKETRGYEIIVRNKKAQPVTIILQDQVPISTVKEIHVEKQEISGASVEKDTGKLMWSLTLKPSEIKKLDLRYEVKYPKDLKLALE